MDARIVKNVAYRYTTIEYTVVAKRYTSGDFCQNVWLVDKTEHLLV